MMHFADSDHACANCFAVDAASKSNGPAKVRMLRMPASIFARADTFAECTMISGGWKSVVATCSSIQRQKDMHSF